MLQKRGWLTSTNAVVATKVQQQFAQTAMSFNFHLTLIQVPINFFSVLNKRAVTLL